MGRTEQGATAITWGGELLNAVQAGPFRVSAADFPPNYSISSHYHEPACISILLSGRLEQRFAGRVIECASGQVLAKPPGERHVDRWFDGWSRHVMIEVDPERHEELGTAKTVTEEIMHLDQLGADLLGLAALRELALADSATPLALEGIVMQLLARVGRGRGRTSSVSDAPAWMSVVMEYLNDNFSKQTSLAELGLLAGVHPDHVSREFSRRNGTTVGQYVRTLRIEAAASLLRGTSERISTIALRCGFSDQSHLTRVFKRAMGVTPARYRNASLG